MPQPRRGGKPPGAAEPACGRWPSSLLRRKFPADEMRRRTALNRWVAPGAVAVMTMMIAVAWSGRAIASCNFEMLGEGRVAGVIDGRTLRLADGREVRLTGIEIPGPETRGATDALGQLVIGRSVVLRRKRRARPLWPAARFRAPCRSRHHGTRPVAGARNRRSRRNRGRRQLCAAEMQSAEAAARTAGLGVWANQNVIKNAESSGDILARIGRFALIDGRVRSAREAVGTF